MQPPTHFKLDSYMSPKPVGTLPWDLWKCLVVLDLAQGQSQWIFVGLVVGFFIPSHERLRSVDARGQVGALSSLSCSPVVFVVWQGTIILMGEVVLFVCGCTATVGGSCHNI